MPDASTLLLPGTVLLDSARPRAGGRSLLFRSPLRVLTAETPGEVPALLRALDAVAAGGHYAAGYLAYEAGRAFERITPAPYRAAGTMPLAWFGVYDAPSVLSHEAVEALLAGAGGAHVAAPHFDPSRAAYDAGIAAVKGAIREGDVYQVNYTGRVRFGFSGSPVALYRRLRARQRGDYAAFLNPGRGLVLSCSPELFFRRDGDRVVTRPMKGTVRRGASPDEDAALAAWLARDEKSRAENLMIVDLLRNDLARCCRPGSVRVPALFETEPYETLIQMTSTIEGRLCEGVGYEALFRALFPCGSVTGAPKIRAMQVIDALEPSPRGVYCGAIGYVAPGSEAAFSVAIRTVVLEGERGEMGTGSGVVWDSNAAAEYEECLLKARFVTEAAADFADAAADFSLIETMRWEGGIALLDRHAARLRASASALGFAFDEAAFRRAVDAAARALERGRAYRVRATLDRSGRLGVTATPLAGPLAQPLRLCLAAVLLPSGDPLRRHKTTRRARYEAAYGAARAAGYDEAVFLNERGEVAEGTRTSVFVRRGDAYVTPPLEAGVLDGVYRRLLLDTLPGAREGVLTPADLAGADALLVCNAVWGLCEAVFEPVPVALP